MSNPSTPLPEQPMNPIKSEDELTNALIVCSLFGMTADDGMGTWEQWSSERMEHHIAAFKHSPNYKEAMQLITTPTRQHENKFIAHGGEPMLTKSEADVMVVEARINELQKLKDAHSINIFDEYVENRIAQLTTNQEGEK